MIRVKNPVNGDLMAEGSGKIALIQPILAVRDTLNLKEKTGVLNFSNFVTY